MQAAAQMFGPWCILPLNGLNSTIKLRDQTAGRLLRKRASYPRRNDLAAALREVDRVKSATASPGSTCSPQLLSIGTLFISGPRRRPLKVSFRLQPKQAPKSQNKHQLSYCAVSGGHYFPNGQLATTK